MRNLFMTMMLLLAPESLGIASTINLNNGSSIQGDIIKQDAKSIQINVDGVTMTYYADEIKDIDGKSFADSSAPQAPAAPADAPAPADTPATPAPAAPADAPAPADTPATPAPAAPADAPAPADTPATPAPAAPADAPAPADTTAAPAPAAPADAPAPADTTATPAPAAAQTDSASATNVPADNTSIDPAKRALILQFIDVFGTRQALINNFDTMLKQIEKDKPDEAQKIRDRVKVDEIIERLLPIYDRNFSSDDLKTFIAFYGSDEGKKLIGTIPELMKESVAESVKYMEEKFPEVKQGQQ